MHKHASLIVASSALAVTMAMLGWTGTVAQSQSSTAGDLRTLSTTGNIDRRNAFFRPLGKQFASTCEHCHFGSDAWGVSAEHIRQMFNSSQGKHPIFTAPSANDLHAALALAADASLTDRQAAFSLLLDKGIALVRRNFDAAA